MTSAPSNARSVSSRVTTSSPTTASSGSGSDTSSVSTPGTPRSSRNTTSSGASSSITGRLAAATTVARLATRHRPSIRLAGGVEHQEQRQPEQQERAEAGHEPDGDVDPGQAVGVRQRRPGLQQAVHRPHEAEHRQDDPHAVPPAGAQDHRRGDHQHGPRHRGQGTPAGVDDVALGRGGQRVDVRREAGEQHPGDGERDRQRRRGHPSQPGRGAGFGPGRRGRHPGSISARVSRRQGIRVPSGRDLRRGPGTGPGSLCPGSGPAGSFWSSGAAASGSTHHHPRSSS